MADQHVVSALRAKRDELDRIIVSYEGALAAARRDFANVTATLELFETDSAPSAYPSRLSIVRMFKRGEIFGLCKAALAEASEGLDTRELARTVIHAKSRDEADSVLRKAIGYRIVQIMLRQEARGHIMGAAKRKGVRVWQLSGNLVRPSASTLSIAAILDAPAPQSPP